MINRHVIHESCGNFLLSLLFSKKVTLGLSSSWYQFPVDGMFQSVGHIRTPQNGEYALIQI